MIGGVLTLKDIVKTFEMPTIGRTETVHSAIKKMLEINSYSLLVPRMNRSDAYGIITKKDNIMPTRITIAKESTYMLPNLQHLRELFSYKE